VIYSSSLGPSVAEGTTEDELQALFDALASPLLAVLHGSKTDGYRVTSSAEVARRRIESVGQKVSTSEHRLAMDIHLDRTITRE
jgi:hypothetical protein